LIFPATPEKDTSEGDTMFDYGFHLFTIDGSWFDNKDLRIIFDKVGTVKDVHFETSRKTGNSTEDSSGPRL
jgi:hypothetical protein